MIAIDGTYNEYSVDTDSEDDPILFEWFPAEDIRRRSDHFMTLGLDCEVPAVTGVSRSVDDNPRACAYAVC